MKFNKWSLIMVAILALAGNLFAQTNPPTNLLQTPGTLAAVTNLGVSATVGAGLSQAYTDGKNALTGLSFKQGFDVDLVGIYHSGDYGGGLLVSPMDTNNPVRVGFGLFALNEKQATGSKQWSFYDATVSISYSQTETIPLINLPIVMTVGAGPAVKLSGGTGVLMEQSEALGEHTWVINEHNNITLGGGVMHCSGLTGVSELGYVRYEHKF